MRYVWTSCYGPWNFPTWSLFQHLRKVLHKNDFAEKTKQPSIVLFVFSNSCTHSSWPQIQNLLVCVSMGLPPKFACLLFWSFALHSSDLTFSCLCLEILFRSSLKRLCSVMSLLRNHMWSQPFFIYVSCRGCRSCFMYMQFAAFHTRGFPSNRHFYKETHYNRWFDFNVMW